MPLIKYKILKAASENAVVHLPEKIIPLGVLSDRETGAPLIIFLMRYADWAEAFPGDAAAEAKEEVEEEEEEKKEEEEKQNAG